MLLLYYKIKYTNIGGFIDCHKKYNYSRVCKKEDKCVLKTVGSIYSGIEAASVAWKPFGLHFKWFSEIASFPSRVLKEKYPDIPNLGDMNNIDTAILKGKIFSPDIICGGTPCQAFSLAGLKNGLNDD